MGSPFIRLHLSRLPYYLLCVLVCILYNAWYELSWILNPHLSTLKLDWPERIVLGLLLLPILRRARWAIYDATCQLIAVGKALSKYLFYGLPREQ